MPSSGRRRSYVGGVPPGQIEAGPSAVRNSGRLVTRASLDCPGFIVTRIGGRPLSATSTAGQLRDSCFVPFSAQDGVPRLMAE
ncbi:MAG: hypothetical protein ABIS92_17120 [Polyangia bacterium]